MIQTGCLPFLEDRCLRLCLLPLVLDVDVVVVIVVVVGFDDLIPLLLCPLDTTIALSCIPVPHKAWAGMCRFAHEVLSSKG